MFFLNSVFRSFQDSFSSYETIQSVGGQKREEFEKNKQQQKHLAHTQAELGLPVSHVARAWLESTPDTAVR